MCFCPNILSKVAIPIFIPPHTSPHALVGLLIGAFPKIEAAVIDVISQELASCKGTSLLIEAYNVKLYTYLYNVLAFKPLNGNRMYTILQEKKVCSDEHLCTQPCLVEALSSACCSTGLGHDIN